MVRYWNSEEHKISFLGIPKTGSTSIRTALGIDVEKDWTVQPKYATFTVLRNPIDRIKSGYMECKRRGTVKLDVSFSDFLKSLGSGFFDNHTDPQAFYFRPVDRVWLFEDLDSLFSFFGVERKHENKSKPYEINETLEDLAIIYNLYGRDFILYEYYKGGNFPHGLGDKQLYFRRFYELVAECNNHQEAYYKLEREFYMLYGRNCYVNYETFKNIKSRYWRDLGKQNIPI